MRVGRRRAALVAMLLAGLGALAVPAAAQGGAGDELATAVSTETSAVAQWVLDSGDHSGRPFAIVDKKAARLAVFAADGRILGATPALLGLAPGDAAVPGLGARPPSQILPDERSTPAGRYASEPGRNLSGEAVVWFDYDAGLAIHRVRPGPSWERRQQRLASNSPDDNRVSLGCVVVAEAFYDGVVEPVLGRSRGVVYVLPETRTAASLFGGHRASLSRTD